MKVSLRPVAVPLRAPHHAAHGAHDRRELLLLEVHDPASGLCGFGEAAPLPDYDGVTIDAARAVLKRCREVLEGDDGRDRATAFARCAEIAVLRPALAAVDLALWDLAGKRAGEPVWRLLAADAGAGAVGAPAAVEVNATISAPDRAGAAAQAAAARAAGFATVKLKVGTGDDAGRVAAVRAAGGPGMRLRLDANGAWTPDEAVRWLEVLAPAGIELCEEPVTGLAELEHVAARTAIPIALDESARLPGALEQRVATAVCLKIGGCGGISGLVAAARRARASGYEVYLASTLDGPLGIAAALHAAAAIRPERASGLATLPLFEGRRDPLPARGGRIAVPEGPGLGDGLSDWYR